MRNKLLISFFIFISLNTFSQIDENFKAGVEVIASNKIVAYKNPSSILFVFEGYTDGMNNLLDLKKRIEKRFKKSLKKEFHSFKIGFNYNLKHSDSSKTDLKSIPLKEFDPAQFETLCYISLSNFQIKNDNPPIVFERNYKPYKINYHLNIELKERETEKTNLNLKLNVCAFKTILTQNKNSAKLIYEHIMEK